MRCSFLVLLLIACGGAPTASGPAGPSRVSNPAPKLGPEPEGGGEPTIGGAWLESVHELFHARWAEGFVEQSRQYLPREHALNDETLEASLKFAVGAEGAVRDVELARPSGNSDFDAAARQLLLDASPLPAPPGDLASDDGLVHVTWRFARDVRQDGVAGAQVERRQWEPERAVPALLAAGRVADAAARLASPWDAKRLPLAREVAGGTLVAALEDEKDPAARIAAADAAAETGYVKAAPELRKLAQSGNDIGVQAAALRALGRLEDQAALPLHEEALAKLDDERGVAAAGALAKMGRGAAVWKQLEPRARGEDARARAAAFAELAEAGLPSSQGLLIEALGGKGRPRAERIAAAAGLASLAGDDRGPAGRALIAALGDGDAAVRAAAAGALAKAPGKSKVYYRAVLPVLNDRDPRVVAAAARAAARHGGAAAVPELARVAARARSKDPQVVASAVAASGEIAGAEALAQLKKWSADKDVEVRVAAVTALGEREDPEARALVARAVGDADARLRLVAVGASTDRDVLQKALGDVAPEVRVAAVRPLVKQLGVEAATPLVLEAIADAHGGQERVLIAREYLLALGKPS